MRGVPGSVPGAGACDKFKPTLGSNGEGATVAAITTTHSIYWLKNVRAVYTYTGSHDKTIIFGLITNNGEGYFERHEKFTKDEFKSFLRNACKKFGKLLMILDRAPQHKAKVVQDALEELNGQVKLLFLPPRLSRPECHRGGVETDEDGGADRTIRQVQKNVKASISG